MTCSSSVHRMNAVTNTFKTISLVCLALVTHDWFTVTKSQLWVVYRRVPLCCIFIAQAQTCVCVCVHTLVRAYSSCQPFNFKVNQSHKCLLVKQYFQLLLLFFSAWVNATFGFNMVAPGPQLSMFPHGATRRCFLIALVPCWQQKTATTKAMFVPAVSQLCWFLFCQ